MIHAIIYSVNRNEKAKTIKIDVRSLAHGRAGVGASRAAVPHADPFDRLDCRFLLDHAQDAVLVADACGTVLAANPRAESFFGYQDAGLDGVAIKMLIAGVTDSILKDIGAALAQGSCLRLQASAVRRDGTCVAVESLVMGSGARTAEPVCYLIRDAQSNWKVEQELLSARHAMDNTDAGIGIATLEGVLTYANRAMVSLLAGGDGRDLVGRRLDTWFDRSAVLEPLLARIRGGETWSGEQRQMSEGQSGWLQMCAVPDINEDRELCGMVVSVRDTAESRRAEIAEQQAALNRATADSLAAACHALGQPATVCLTGIEMLKQENELDADTRREVLDLCYEAAIQLREQMQRLCARRKESATPGCLCGGRPGESRAGTGGTT